MTTENYFAVKVKDIDIPIRLNEESIGYDWITFDGAIRKMKHNDEKKVLEILLKSIS